MSKALTRARITKKKKTGAGASKAASKAQPASRGKAAAKATAKKLSTGKTARVRPKPKKATAKAKSAAKATSKTASKAGAKSAAKPLRSAVASTRSAPKAKAKAKALPRKRDAKRSEIALPENYRPSESEPFMGERQRIYFRNKLQSWKEDILRQNRETIAGLHEDSTQHADIADRATSETDRALELRARDRQRKLIAKIDAAVARIEDGSYGYCEETGEPIGLKRLDARPIATLSIEAQERHERRERVFRDD